MRHDSILILLAVVKAVSQQLDEVPTESECAVFLLQTEFRLTKATQDLTLHVRGTHSDNTGEYGKGHQKAGVMLSEQPAEHNSTATKLDLMAWPHRHWKEKAHSALTAKQNSIANKTELKASSEYAKDSRPRQASSEEQLNSGVANVRLNSELQTRSLVKESNASAHITASRKAVNQTVTEEAEAWSASETLAWVQVELQKPRGAPVLLLFAALVTCMCTAMLLTAKLQEGNRKDSNDWPLSPHRAGPAGTNLRSSPSTPGSSSQVHTQQSLMQQRTTPLVSSSQPSPGGSMLHGLQQVVTGDDFNLPPICPSLILPHTEARFVIDMNRMKRMQTGPFDILGTSGRKLLDALVCDAPGRRRCLMLASCGCGDDPRTCVFTAKPGSSPPSTDSEALEIFGRAGKFYGWLEFPGGMEVMLLHSGVDGKVRRVLRIEMESASDLRMAASTMDGRVLASCGRSAAGQVAAQQFEGIDTWYMQVKPGIDAVLITSCILALIFLRSWPSADGRISLASWADEGTSTSIRQPGTMAPSPRTSMLPVGV